LVNGDGQHNDDQAQQSQKACHQPLLKVTCLVVEGLQSLSYELLGGIHDKCRVLAEDSSEVARAEARDAILYVDTSTTILAQALILFTLNVSLVTWSEAEVLWWRGSVVAVLASRARIAGTGVGSVF